MNDAAARRWLANKLASWARHLYPESEEVMSFWADRMTELVITGQTHIRIQEVPMDGIYQLDAASKPEEGK